MVRTIVKNLRRKLGDDAKNPTYIVTEPRVGYRMERARVPPSVARNARRQIREGRWNTPTAGAYDSLSGKPPRQNPGWSFTGRCLGRL